MKASESPLSIREILDILGICEAICIDDAYESQALVPIETVLGLVEHAVDDAKTDDAGQILAISNLSQPRLIWEPAVRSAWVNRSPQEQHEIITGLRSLLCESAPPEDERHSLGLLRTYFSNAGLLFSELTPSEWADRRGELLDAKGSSGLLCLIDLRLDTAGTDSDTQGARLLRDAVQGKRTRPVTFAILTNRTSIENEWDLARDLCREHGLEAQDIVVLSKSRLQEIEQFADGLRMAALNAARDMLADVVGRLHECAAHAAARKLKQLNLPEFEHMVIKRSAHEGIWEAETVFRLYRIAETQAFEQLAYDEQRRQDLDRHVSHIRRLQGAAVQEAADRTSPDDRLNLLRSEILQDGEFVNLAHLPIELGDIFEITARTQDGDNAKYVVVGPPCDLQLRADGKRKASDVAVCKLEAVPRPRKSSSVSNKEHLVCRVPYLFGNDADLCVDMGYIYHISLDVLDLASLNPDGRCTVSSCQHIPNVRESLRVRIESLVKQYRDYRPIICELQTLAQGNDQRQMREGLTTALVRGFTRFSGDIPVDFGAESIEFGIRRCGRIRRSKAQEVLLRYVSVLGRPAAEVDLLVD